RTGVAMETSTDKPVPSPPQPERRTFFRRLTAVMAAIGAAAAGLPIIGYFFATRKSTVHWVDLGAIDEFALEETRMIVFDNALHQPWDGIVARTGVFVRFEGRSAADDDQFLVLAVNCAHLGCPVSWFPQSGLFMCPCHGGVYYADGERASGPPPRGLFHCV